MINKIKSKVQSFAYTGGDYGGGFGKRLFPFTNVLPKVIIPIKNKTVIEVIIDKFLNYGINNFILSVNLNLR